MSNLQVLLNFDDITVVRPNCVAYYKIINEVVRKLRFSPSNLSSFSIFVNLTR